MLLARLSPILGAGAIGVCPLCWAGSASFLTYIGLGALIPAWRKIALAFLLLGLLGFFLDYRSHRRILPLLLLLVGGALLYLGRYLFVVQPPLHLFPSIEGFAGWPVWGAGGILIVIAVVLNRYLFRKPVRS